MEKDRIIELLITDSAEDGKGIGHADGMAVFVAGAVPGDRVLARVTKAKKNYAFADVTEILVPSGDRVEAACPYFGRCGGCALQELSIPAQLRIKRTQVRDKLIRIGGFSDPSVLDFPKEACPEDSFRYRNKAVFSVLATKSGPVVGFKERGSNRVVDIPDCLLQKEPVMAAANALRELIRSGKLPVYDARSGKGFLREFTVKLAEGTGEMMLVLTGASRRLPNAETIIYAVADAISEASVRSGYIDPGAPAAEEGPGDAREDADSPEAGALPYYFLQSVVVEYKRGDLREPAADYVVAAGSKTITDRVCYPEIGRTLDYEISAPAFYQVNTKRMVTLYETAAAYAGLTGGEILLDLYCGIGTIGLALSDRAHMVVGIESVPGAVIDANRNAVINGIVNARYYKGRAEDVLPELCNPASGLYAEYLFSGENQDATGSGSLTLPASSAHRESSAHRNTLQPARPVVAILDPPRAGCDEGLLRSVASFGGRGADRIVYISCDPGTLARDLKLLGELGYTFRECTPVSMFDHTTHVESCVLIDREWRK